MLIRSAIAFFVLALVSVVLGMSGLAGLSMDIAKTLIGVFLVLAILSFLASLFTGRKTNLLK